VTPMRDILLPESFHYLFSFGFPCWQRLLFFALALVFCQKSLAAVASWDGFGVSLFLLDLCLFMVSIALFYLSVAQ
jgi:hypothetical protein